MARIVGVNIPDNKRIVVALTYIYGIGNTAAQEILAQSNIDATRRTKDLSEKELDTIREIVRKKSTEGDLKREVLTNIRRLKSINSYIGTRHVKHLPVHGQRTKTNSRTVRGNVRRTMGSGKIKGLNKT